VADDAANWEMECIPDASYLFLRIHRNWLKGNDIIPGFFKNTPNTPTAGMSCDWDKYSTKEESQRARDPAANGVLEIVTREVRGIEAQIVRHDPDMSRNNRAHSQVFGEKTPEARLKLKRISRWAIQI
jgi:hypothetical protein